MPIAVKEQAAVTTPAVELLEAEASDISGTVVGSRYSTAITSSTPEVAAPAPLEIAETTVVEPSQEADTKDIARGQEPDSNPLRPAPKSLDKANDLDARTAFGQNPPDAKPLATAPQPPMASSPFGKRANANPPTQQHTASQANSRYRAANAGILSQEPTPALGIESPQPLRKKLSPTPAAPMRVASQTITPTPGLTNRTGTGRPGEQLLEGAQSPSITIQKLAPEEIQVGKRCTFAIRVQNTGQRTAQNVQIRDEVPLGTELVGTAPRAAVS
ncbi:MAG: hypothetical protein GXP28_04395, partial [Planctomycetes bacterium]|nr:hypothetical protein [Planctomycetota bacterium]